MFNWSTITYGIILTLVDVISLPIIKSVNINALSKWFMIIPTLLYASDSFIFYNALKNEGMAIMNLVWNLISNISVSLIGIVYFKEIISPFKILGMLLSIVSILLMTYSG